MLSLLVVILAFSVSVQQQQQQQYQLVDMSFATPLCPTIEAGVQTPNSLSTLLLSNDILGERLLLSLSPTTEPDFSCYLCRQNPAYCTTPLDPSLIQPALDSSGYNTQVLDLDARTVTNYQTSLDQETIIEGAVSGCGGQSHRLLVTLLLTINLPTSNQSREFLTLAMAPPTTEEQEGVSCEADSAVYGQLGISCHQFPRLYPLVYQSSQCLVVGTDSSSIIPAQPNLTYLPPLYWYAALVFGNTSLVPLTPTLICGTRYDVMLFAESELYETQCLLNQSALTYSNLARHWWHALFVQFLTLQFNARASGQQNNTLVQYASWRLLDQLERTCHARNHSLADNHSLVFLLYWVQGMYSSSSSSSAGIETRPLCDSLQQYFVTTFPSQERDYFAFYLQSLSFLVYPNKVVQNRLVVFVVSLFVFLLLCVMSVGIVAYPLRVTFRSPMRRI